MAVDQCGRRGPRPGLERLTERRLVIVGLGGIGGIVARFSIKFLAALGVAPVRVLLVDGDTFEERNRDRMDFEYHGNKAEVVCERLSEEYGRPGLHIRPVSKFVDQDNVGEIVRDGDLVLLCVDNHASRKILSDHSEGLHSVTLISGGNDGVENGQRGTYGNVQVHVRRDGADRSPALTRFHPEIADPADEVPGPSCVDLAATTAPQILFTNLAAASHMLNAFYRWLEADDEGGDSEKMYDEVCFDIHEARAVPHRFGLNRTTTTR
jgi:molybdopterin/thiamine biosynthesis adenylyltransferase